ncbi:uncharacterized protein wu:fa56d06 [Coregonus clupeaformis]|uniref:uncharacterized protein wu:fa56d06 n=1 Tax=Coregonus clupeaformis TaxID=59861 RepID=UPI001BDFB904|nr:uncharacterized protein wu:fa56d06 [Coregonus clupeaformis]
MLTFTLLLLALSSLHAAPLRDDVVAPPRGRLQDHKVLVFPRSVPVRDHVVAPPRGRLQDRKVLVLPRSVPVEERRQGTEPSRRFIMDLNTGLVKEHISEMDRRVGHMYVPPSVDEFRQGTENSQKTLVDIRSGRIIKPVGEMARSMKLTPQEPMEVPVPVQRRVGGWVRADVLPRSVPVEERRQGTEPSRRFIMDLNTGLVKEHISEMDRRVGHMYVPPSVDEFRQGTENSQKTLVDIRSGRIIKPVGEMARSMKLTPQEPMEVPVPVQRRVGGWVRADVLPRSVPVEERRQGTEPSRRFIMDLNTGLVKEHISEMDRRVGHMYVPPSVDEFRQGTENSQKTLVDIRSGRIIKPVGEMARSMKLTPQEPMEVPVPVQRRVGGWVRADVLPRSVPVEERRQGTEPSRRFIMDLNTGLVKEHISEMDRRVAPVYTPPSVDEYRQGTENSQKTLVDIRSGRIIRPVGQMERSNRLIPQDVRLVEAEVEVRSVPVEERRQGSEPPRRFIMDLNTGLVKKHVSEMDRRVAPDDRLVRAKAETHSETECVGEVIDGHCYQFNPTLMTFSEAESSCSVLSPHGHLASVTNGDLHSRLVSMVTKATKSPVLTWLGGVVKDEQSEWTDGSAWGYSDWMPGHPDTQTDKQACLEMFRIDESWWTAVDCELKRASICSFPMAA